MDGKIFVDPEYSLAAVKLQGRWRFFYDWETMFILNYTAYHADYVPKPGGFRDGTLIVGEHNADVWMNMLAGEASVDQLPLLFWEGSEVRVRLTFVIDFDSKLWVGCRWRMDQSPLADYQPDGWTAIEDDLKPYLPSELRDFWE
jgi:hypothetical protein